MAPRHGAVAAHETGTRRPIDGSRVARRRARRRHQRQIAGAIGGVVILCAGGAVVALHLADQTPGSAATAPPAPSSPTFSSIGVASQKVSLGNQDLFTLPAIAQYLSQTDDGLTAAVYDADTGHTSLYQPGVAETTASIMKVDILATLLAREQADDDGLSASEQQLTQAMIEQSDNDAAQSLWDAEGGATGVSSFNASAGLTQTAPNGPGYWGLSTTTAADQVQLLRQIAYPSNVLDPGSQGYALNLMANVEAGQNWGVSAGVAPGTTVDLKNGWLPLDTGGWQINSIGYVNGSGRNYVIAVLTDANSGEAQGIDAIQGLSALVWQALAPGATVSDSGAISDPSNTTTTAPATTTPNTSDPSTGG